MTPEVLHNRLYSIFWGMWWSPEFLDWWSEENISSWSRSSPLWFCLYTQKQKRVRLVTGESILSHKWSTLGEVLLKFWGLVVTKSRRQSSEQGGDVLLGSAVCSIVHPALLPSASCHPLYGSRQVFPSPPFCPPSVSLPYHEQIVSNQLYGSSLMARAEQQCLFNVR